MTDAICYRDAYARAVEATVLASAPAEPGGPVLVVLDRTVFYPGGGGQPSDRGVLLRASDGRRWVVTGARKDGSDIVHQLDLGDARARRPSATGSRPTSTGLAATR